MESFTTTPAESYIELRDKLDGLALFFERMSVVHREAGREHLYLDSEAARSYGMSVIYESCAKDVRNILDGECTGDLDTRTGTVQHDGDTCPIHEAE